MKRGIIFPGQGSQFVGMGRDVVSSSDAARRVFECANDALGIDLRRIAFEGPEATLTATRYAQPAILATSIAVLRALPETPWVAAAGHSLGEWTALVAADAMDLTDAIRLVGLRGQLMQDASPPGVGAMSAVIGLAPDVVEDLVEAEQHRAPDSVGIAGYNGSAQVVVSGTADAVASVCEKAKDAGALKIAPLDVSAAFHSPLMRSVESPLRAALDQIEVRDPVRTVVSSVDGCRLDRADGIRDTLIAQLCAPVRWGACLRELAGLAADEWFVIGPGASLARMSKRFRVGPRIVVRDESHVTSLGSGPQR